MFGRLKAIVLWGFARNTWQYDVLCLLILSFIFLTPKHWFENKDMTHRQVVLTVEPGRNEYSRQEIELKVQSTAKQNRLEVLDIRPQRDANGRVVAYEVDIR